MIRKYLRRRRIRQAQEARANRPVRRYVIDGKAYLEEQVEVWELHVLDSGDDLDPPMTRWRRVER